MTAKFGFLNEPIKMEFGNIFITPLPDYDRNKQYIENQTHMDGFIYPPICERSSCDAVNEEICSRIPKTKRTALYFPLLPSHSIEDSGLSGKHEVFHSSEFLIIQLLAYMYGVRLQFQGWGFDGRVPQRQQNNIRFKYGDCQKFIKHVLDWWENLEADQGEKFLNILYAYNRAKCIELDWDAFLNQYMVLDAIDNLHASLNKIKVRPPHKERLKLLLCEYEIASGSSIPNDKIPDIRKCEPEGMKKAIQDKIVNARNNLIHESIWCGMPPGADVDHDQLAGHLCRINSRIICAITGCKNEYTKSNWSNDFAQLFEFPVN